MDDKKKRRFSIGKKMYIFLFAIVLLAIIGTCAISFAINVNQIDTYYKKLTFNVARNYASFADRDFLMELRVVAESEEYQNLRDEAEENEDDSLVIDYLKGKNLWERYSKQRDNMIQYLSTMPDVKYLYLIVWSGMDDTHDMYLVDADDVPFYETGYYELREEEFSGVDPTKEIEAVINHGDWGWLCSGYAPVYDDEGNIICHVGCDIDMEEVMNERRFNITVILIVALVYIIIVMVIAVLVVNKSVIRPLYAITREMGNFSPAPEKSYEESGVLNLDIKSGDEIGDIYNEIRSMQVRIIDYIKDIVTIRQDKEKAEDDIRNKDMMIGRISEVAYKDNLTGIGNNTSYLRKSNELNELIKNGNRDFSIVMVDANGLKGINDNFGHSYGDLYLKGCSKFICGIFKHSPVFRIGGDEFVAVALGEDYENRADRVQTLRNSFEESYNDAGKDPWLRFSASVGISDCTEGDSSVEQVFKRADKNMYEDKIQFKTKHHLKT